MSPVELLLNTLITSVEIYSVLLILRFLLSWFPNINWFDPPFSILSQLTDPYINLFRALIPPMGGIDFIGPTLALVLLQVLMNILASLRHTLA